MSYTLQNPLAYFPLPTKSSAAGLCKLYVGLIDTDPLTPANQVQVYAVQPDGSELAIPQPVQLSAGGLPQYNGSPIQLKITADVVSVKVTTSSGALVSYTPRWSAEVNTAALGDVDSSVLVGGIKASLLSSLFVDVRVFGAVGDGVTDCTPALKAARQYLAARGGGSIQVPAGNWLLNGEPVADGRIVGFVFPQTNPNSNTGRIHIVGAGRGATKFLCGVNNMSLFLFADSHCSLRHFSLNANGKTGCRGFEFGPENRAGNTLETYSLFNEVTDGYITGFDIGQRLTVGLSINGSDSGCWYNRVDLVDFFDNVIGIYSPPALPGSVGGTGRNTWSRCRIGQGRTNTGFENNGGGTQNLLDVHFEGILAAGPTPTPTAIIDRVGTNYYTNCIIEACTRHIENSGIYNIWIGGSYDSTKCLFIAPWRTEVYSDRVATLGFVGAGTVNPTTPIDARDLNDPTKQLQWSRFGMHSNTNRVQFGTASLNMSFGHVLSRSDASQGDSVFSAYGDQSGFAFEVFDHRQGGGNASATAVRVGRNSTTSRSINAGGTINASGADYAEYERNNGISFEKGDIVGFKADGTLTNKYSESVRFGIKSTNPSIVGGDNWATEEIVGRAPVKPETEDVDELNAYESAKREFENRVEEKRAFVDRIAYCGKVPVNVLDAVAGDYLIAAKGGEDQITALLERNPSFEQYKKAIGKVNRILEDGRAEVVVMM